MGWVWRILMVVVTVFVIAIIIKIKLITTITKHYSTTFTHSSPTSST